MAGQTLPDEVLASAAMVEGSGTDGARAALLALADLTPKPGASNESLAVPTDWFTWLPDGLALFGQMVDEATTLRQQLWNSSEGHDVMPSLPLARNLGEQLAAIQQVRSGTPMRVGWLWVAGTAELPDASGTSRRRRVLHPLVVRPARVVRAAGSLGKPTLVAAGDIEVTPRVPPEVRRTLPEWPETGGGALGRLDRIDPALFARLPRLQRYAMDLAAAAGFPADEFVLEQIDPDRAMRHDGPRIVVGVALYCTEATDTVTRGNTLRTWATRGLDEPTALHTVYTDAEPAAPTQRGPLETTLPLNASQRAAVQRARSAPLTVITGAPGTGKSHTIAAAVADALHHGESVLVTAKTEAAVDALIDLLQRQPGPEPVVFGSTERRAQLAARLAAGQLAPATDEAVAAADAALQRAIAERDRTRAALTARIEAELARVGRSEVAASVRSAFPGVFDGRVDAATLTAILAGVDAGLARWWWPRRRARATLRDLAGRLGAPPDTAATATLWNALSLATAMSGEVAVDPTAAHYLALEVADERVRAALGSHLAVASRSPDRLDRSRLAAVAALATALRAGRETRRTQLERMAGDRLVDALPLWVGTLGDVDDLLPPTPALFDLVVIDEASSTEQTLAAPALLRARRAIVAGDPRQLRHVSFVADGAVDAVLAAHGLLGTPAAPVLDLRRNSAFDAAASAAPVSLLDEHHRCDPHLVDVVAQRLYPGELTVATRSPLTESHDCVHVERVTGRRDAGGVVGAEVDRVLAELRHLHAVGSRSVAVVSPFRAQVEAIEARVLAELSTTTIVDLDLRIGTAHGMQGNERDVVICSMGLGDGDRGARRFAEDEHLLAVLLTRARRRLVLLLSYEPEPETVLAEYVARADTPPGRPAPAAVLTPWVADLRAELQRAGVDAAPAYPVGRQVVDLAMRAGDTAVAVIAGVHADGVDAHVDRHLLLLRRAWRIVEVPESLWHDRPGETALEVAALLRPGDAGPLPAAG